MRRFMDQFKRLEVVQKSNKRTPERGWYQGLKAVTHVGYERDKEATSPLGAGCVEALELL